MRANSKRSKKYSLLGKESQFKIEILLIYERYINWE